MRSEGEGVEVQRGTFEQFRSEGKIARCNPPLEYIVLRHDNMHWNSELIYSAVSEDERVAALSWNAKRISSEWCKTPQQAIQGLRRECCKILFGHRWRRAEQVDAIPVEEDPDFQSRRPVAAALFAALHVHLAEHKKWQGIRYEQVQVPAGYLDLVVATGPHEIQAFEVKSCREDFRSDSKWPKYLAYCHRLSFVTIDNAIGINELPDNVGLYTLNPQWRAKDGARRQSREAHPLVMLRPAAQRLISVDAMLQVSFALIRKGVSCTGLSAAEKVLTDNLTQIKQRLTPLGGLLDD